MQTPGVPPSFKQVGVGGRRGSGWELFTTEYQGGWLRSMVYTRNER